MSTNGASAHKGLIRQGDVLLVPVPRPRAGEPLTELERVEGRLVLAEGEATGHAHAVLDGHARLVERTPTDEPSRTTTLAVAPRSTTESPRRLLIVARRPATLVHEEHDPLTIPPGTYEVRRQREYVPATRARSRQERWVRD